MPAHLQIGNALQIANANYQTRMELRVLDGGSDTVDLALYRMDTNGQIAETIMTVDGGTGIVSFTENLAAPYRTVASDVVPTIIASDRAGTIELLASASGAKAILTDTSGADAVELGQTVTIFLTARSGGSYTLALSTGTLTFDAALECAEIVRTSLGWNVVSLNGATIV